MFQPDGAELFHFDDGFSSWDANLSSFVTDNTRDDHVILHGAASNDLQKQACPGTRARASRS